MNILVAAVLSLVFPGAGQAYNGQIKKGIGFGLFFLLAPFPLLFLASRGQEWAMWTTGGLKAVVPLIALIDAAGRAYEIGKGSRDGAGGGWRPGLCVLVGGLVLNAAVSRLIRPLALSVLSSVK